MKHFLIEITYTVPAEGLGEVVAAHRAFLREGYDRGLLLLSGPQVPRVGGIAVGRAESREEIEAFFNQDPYLQAGVATHRIVEFDPVLRQDWLETWVMGQSGS
ncbi:YciI family protein [Levilinea saccharolytica]|uniref:YCII-related domain-containing protein n=1 Tax=Levilinea saccharolytica TaxID=229921 RepID=A0A0N8GSP0_9CHLR|nr:YciI family protein [Levilinea saccharolytica]KPL89834.1 hypothetical protein ADN01_02835 [Levilinea saccharolytica]GAP16487.1 uncharacterized protein conserved in bacteria [Levilinea saccharolytica]